MNLHRILYRLHLPCRYIAPYSYTVGNTADAYLCWWEWRGRKWGARMLLAGF